MTHTQLPLPKTRPSLTDCQLGNHPVDQRDILIYTDDAHGIPDEISVCRACWAAHILKYYPGGLMAAHIREHPGEYK
jgi:hypothetical protein